MTYKIKDKFIFLAKSSLLAKEGEKKGFFPFYTSSTIQDKYRNDYLYEGECVILGTGGGPSIHFQDQRFSVSSECFVLHSKSKDYSAKLLYYFLQGNIHILEKGFKGAGLKHISKVYIENIEIPDFDIMIQNQIISKLDKLQSLIDKRKETILLTDKIIRSTFLKMFGDPILNLFNWDKKMLGDPSISKLERGRFSARPRNDPSYFDGNYPFIQTGDISKSKHRLYKFQQTLNERGIRESKKFSPGDVVIAIVGATLGATAILQIETYATDSIIAIKCNESNNIFIEMLLRFHRKTLKDSAPSAEKANINLSILRNLEIICPPVELQNKFGIMSKGIENNKDELQKSLTNLKMLFHTIIQQTFRKDGLREKSELDMYLNDIVLQEELVGRVNTRDFEVKEEYESLQKILFQLLERSDSKIIQLYNPQTRKIELQIK